MSQNSPIQESNSFLSFIKGIYDAVITLLQGAIRNLAKNVIVIIGCAILVFGWLIYKNIKSSKLYEASFTVTYDELVRKIYGDRLAKIDLLLVNEDYTKVANLLSLPIATVRKINKVEGKNILGEKLTEDLNTDKIPFIVSMMVSDSSIISAVQKGVVGFLETGNTYMADKNVMKQREISEEVAFIDAQLIMLDSMKRKANMTNTTATKEGNESVTAAYNFSYELYKKKQDLLRKKEFPGVIQVLDDAIVAKRAGSSIVKIILLGIIGTAVLYAFIAMLLIPVFRRKN